MVTAASARIREITDSVGQGWPEGTGPVAALDDAGAQLTRLSAETAAAWRATESSWTGSAADRASELTAATVAAVEEMTAELNRMSAATAHANAAVTAARARLESIVAEFEKRATAVEAALEGPAAERAVEAEGRRAINEATAVVDQLKSDLNGHAATVSQPPAVTTPQSAGSGFGMPSLPSGGFGSGSGGDGGGMPAQSAGWSGLKEGVERTGPQPEAAEFGSGVSVALPDGTTSTAPNAVAASAVRHALTQLGVPYDWGGTAPGVGLDCSGLTQWAYHEAGLNLPRLAQEQDIGTAISRGSLRAGDLAVWDGHVAMIVGNNMMIEAGDPVQLSPIRTTNAGQGFQGFWRPTA